MFLPFPARYPFYTSGSFLLLKSKQFRLTNSVAVDFMPGYSGLKKLLGCLYSHLQKIPSFLWRNIGSRIQCIRLRCIFLGEYEQYGIGGRLVRMEDELWGWKSRNDGRILLFECTVDF